MTDLGHPAVPVLADHEVARWSRGGTLAHCTAAGDEYAAHLADMLQQAGLLAPSGAAALDRALAAAQDWIADQRTAAEQRTGGDDAETVTGDPTYAAALERWSDAADAVKALRELMLNQAETPTTQVLKEDT